jgi:ADP-ribose pyrophosphatase YjhB (NUDIX family)
MTSVRVRAVLLDGDDIVMFRRVRPDVPVYWSLVGGGMDPGDADLPAALYRELDEELRAEVTPPVPLATLDTVDSQGRSYVQHLFACRLISMDFANRHGPEFSNPAKGSYEVARVPFTAQALAELNLVPEPIAEYLRDNIARIREACPPI